MDSATGWRSIGRVRASWLACALAAVGATGASGCGGAVVVTSETTPPEDLVGPRTARRARPRRRAVTSTLDEAAQRAARCLPETLERVEVSGVFRGTDGAFVVRTIEPAAQLREPGRTCVWRAFQAARVDPFRDATFESFRAVTRADAATGTATAGAGATEASGATAESMAPNTTTTTTTTTTTGVGPTAGGATATTGATASTATGATGATATVTGTAGSASPPGVTVSSGGGVAPSTTVSADEESAITNVLRSRVGPLRGCYERGLARDPGLSVRLRVSYRIEPAGVVSSASSTTVVLGGNPDAATLVASCAETVMRETTFVPRPTGAPLDRAQAFDFVRPGVAPPNTPPPQGTSAQVAAVLHANAGAVRDCYNRALADDSALAGDVLLRFALDPQGRVSGVSAMPRPRAGDAGLLVRVARCVEDAVRRLTFPASGAGATYALPLEFGPGT